MKYIKLVITAKLIVLRYATSKLADLKNEVKNGLLKI